MPFTGRPGYVLAWTVAVAGVAQFLVVAVAAREAGMALRLPRPRITPGVRRLVVLMVPGVLSAGVLQLNLIIGTVIASFRDGAVSYLYYADRIYQLPLGVIGIAFGVVLLPELSRKLRAGATGGGAGQPQPRHRVRHAADPARRRRHRRDRPADHRRALRARRLRPPGQRGHNRRR